MSVGEWLNRVVEQDDENRGVPRPDAFEDDDRDYRRPAPRRFERVESRRDSRDDEEPRRRPRDAEPARRDRHHANPDRDRVESAPVRPEHGAPRRGRDERSRQGQERDQQREVARMRDDIRETARAEAHREANRVREDIGDVHARLDKLSRQLERLADGVDSKRPTTRLAASAPPPVEPDLPLTGAPPPRRRAKPDASLSIEDAVAEIAARQQALDSEATPPVQSRSAAPAAAPASTPALAPQPDFSGLEKQLRQITARIEALQPSNGIEKAITAVRTDLAEIGRQLTEALPRRAVESLEIEVKALAERIDHSRQTGVDANALAGLEHGLAEIREALRRLTPAENLVGFDEAVNALSQKVDLIVAREDPSALQQLEAAIGSLRGVVSHVASNDTLTKVAEEVRMLAAQVDGIANSAATGHAVSALEQRLDTLTAALTASSQAGHAVPRELEKLLAGLIEKLEWVQLTHTDHAALAHLEDRIATLVKRFDASDARLGHLEAIERGLADLLVHLDQMRGANGTAAVAARLAPPPAPQAIEREVAEIKQTERRTQDALEQVHGTVEQVVDRLATIESGLNRDPAPAAPPPPRGAAAQDAPAAEFSTQEIAAPAVAPAPAPVPAPPPPSLPRSAALRPPIDPNLPPDHPLEPGSAANRSRPMPSAAERIAASEAAIGSSKPPVISDSGRTNFIAAARRAARAAAWEASGNPPESGDAGKESTGGSNKLSERLRKLIVAGGALLILLGCVRIATRLYDYGSSAPAAQQHSERVSPTAGEAAAPATPGAAPALPAVDPGESPARAVPALPRVAKPGRHSMAPEGEVRPLAIAVPPVAQPDRQPGYPATPPLPSPDFTGALPQQAIAPSPPPGPSRVAVIEDKLPATIGDPALRAAAMAGNPAAAYEVAIRFAEGRGVPQNNQEAARWLDRAAKQGLVPAQFRLGGLYEKGTGVKKDLATARDLYLAAAEKGNGKAMHNLAVLYAEGVNGPPDYRNAAKWFREAAEHGIRDSQYNLGILYARGIGVDQNYAESYKWFAIAANHGDREAAKKRDEVSAHLDAQSLEAARKAVEAWVAKPQPDDAINVKVAAAWTPPPKSPRASKPRTRPTGTYYPALSGR
jgi:localization factor PodJL